MENTLDLNIFFRTSGCVKIFICLYLCCVSTVDIHAQAKSFSEKDMDKLKESETIKTRAGEQQIKANQTYQEISGLKQKENFENDKKLQKEFNDLQKKAWGHEQKSAELFGESNKIKWDLYKKYITDFWKNFVNDQTELINARLIEEKGSELLYRAASERESAKKSRKPDDAIQKLSGAYEMELMGLEKLEMAYKIYCAWPDVPDYENTTVHEEQVKDPSYGYYETAPYVPEETALSAHDTSITYVDTSEITNNNNFVTGSDISSSSDVQVDNERLMRFREYLDEHKDDSLYVLQNYISGYDMSSVRQFWAIYQGMELDDRNKVRASSGFISGDTDKEFDAQTNIQENQLAENYNEYEKTGYGTANENEMEIGIVSEEVKTNDNANLVYRIQIAKNKTPLSQGLLQRVYKGNYDIGMINEDGWYKYSIGDFYSYPKADSFRNNLGIEEAFIVAYRDIVRFEKPVFGENKKKERLQENGQKPEDLISVSDLKDKPQSYKPPEYEGDEDKIIFIVQVAASRNPLTKEQIEKIYPGSYKVHLRQEEGWYKFQIGHSCTYEEAKEVLGAVMVRGAFIAAYKGDNKIKLWEAIRYSRESQNEVVFMLQFATSKNPLPAQEQLKRYNRIEKIQQIYEDGVYKYQIEAGSNYETARRAKNMLAMKGSFIVPYRNGEKLSIQEAIELTK